MRELSTSKKGRVIVKKCHVCGEITVGHQEPMRCTCCKKAFLPANYFSKVHAKNSEDYSKLFLKSDELHEDDLVKGINVLW